MISRSRRLVKILGKWVKKMKMSKNLSTTGSMRRPNEYSDAKRQRSDGFSAVEDGNPLHLCKVKARIEFVGNTENSRDSTAK